MLSDLRGAGQIDKAMIEWSKSRDGLTKVGIEVSAYDAAPTDIAAKSCIGVTGGKPKPIPYPRLGDGMPAEQVQVVYVALRDKTLRARWRHYRRKLTCASLQIQAIVDGTMFVTHPEIDIGITKGLQGVERENIARLINVAEGGHDLARRIDRQAS